MSKRFKYRLFLVENFGSSQGLLSFLRSYDAPLPGKYAVEKWFSKGRLPTEWAAIILAYLEIDRGGPISLIGYLKE